MARRVVFLDVDGTLLNDRGLVPASARAAVRGARANGHLVLLATGRSMSELWDEIVDVGFDGIIAAAGGYIEYEGEVLAHRNIPVEQVRRVMDYFDPLSVNYILEANTGLYASPDTPAQLHRLLFGSVTDDDALAEMERGFTPIVKQLIVGADMRRADINKILFLSSDVPFEQILAEFSDTFDVIPATIPHFGASSGELAIAGVHKAAAIEELLEHLDIQLADTMAYGDGHNDVEMMELVSIGVAMRNAPQTVKDVADDITGSPDEDGIHASFTKYGLI